MMFWVRHALLIILCIILPFGAALYLDTGAELSRAREVGERAAQLAKDTLSSQLRLRAHESLAEVTQVARRVSRASDLGQAGREAPGPGVKAILRAALGEDGFACYVDPAGRILSSVGEGAPAAESIRGRPSFVVTQRGISLDTVWSDEDGAHFVAASPVPVDTRANGAVFIGRPIDAAWLKDLASGTGADLSLLLDGAVSETTLGPEARSEMEAALATEDGAGHFGRPDLSSPAELPFLPLLFDHKVHAYSTASMNWQGDPRVGLQVSVHSGDRLRGLAPRQLTVLGAMAASLMLAILIGLINSRTFVHPLGVIESHLSELQMGRGGAELPERKVSQPFRRLVRLINMTVQKIPPRGYGSAASSIDLRAPEPSSSGSSYAEPAPVNLSRDASGPLAPEAFSSGPGLGSADIQALPSGAPPPAAIPEDLPPEEPPAQAAAFEGDEGSVAAALDSLTEQPAARRSANDIRGGSPMSLSTADLSLADPPPSELGRAAGMPSEREDDRLRDATQVAHSPHQSTVVASVPEDLLAQALDAQLGPEPEPESEDEERSHHREVFQKFIHLRRRFGEPTADLVFEKFERKLQKNRDQLVQKYGCKTVRFQVYEKAGKAALKASPVR